MQVYELNRFRAVERRILALACAMVLCFAGYAATAVAAHSPAHSPAQSPPPQRTPPAVGTIKSISGDLLTLATDSGGELKVQLAPEVKVLRVPPGSKDLKTAAPIQLSDLQPGDRILVRVKPGADASAAPVALLIVAMSKSDIAAKQQKDREEWQRHGIGGLVSSVDPAQNTVSIKTMTAAGTKEVAIHAGQNTVLRRYAPGSVNFDAATVAPITEIHTGDQLRARGTRSADGSEFTADEIVSGSFRNIAGMVTGVNASGSTMTLTDLATKKPVELKITPDSQMRKLPQEMAQRIAMRLKGAGGAPGGNANGGAKPVGQPGGAPPANANVTVNAGQGAASNSGSPGMGGGQRGAGGGDLQQMLTRLPVSPLNEFQKGDVVMVVATSGQGDGPSTVITLLGGVEPILQATSNGQAASILSPWSLSQGGGGDMGTQ